VHVAERAEVAGPLEVAAIRDAGSQARQVHRLVKVGRLAAAVGEQVNADEVAQVQAAARMAIGSCRNGRGAGLTGGCQVGGIGIAGLLVPLQEVGAQVRLEAGEVGVSRRRQRDGLASDLDRGLDAGEGLMTAEAGEERVPEVGQAHRESRVTRLAKLDRGAQQPDGVVQVGKVAGGAEPGAKGATEVEQDDGAPAGAERRGLGESGRLPTRADRVLEILDLALDLEAISEGEAKVAERQETGGIVWSGPHGFKITMDRVAGDEDLGRFIDQKSGQSEFYFVYLSISFATHDGPLLEASQVNLALTGGPEPPAPFALSMRPAAEGTAETLGRTVTIGPKLTLPVVGAVEAGSFSDQRSYQQTSLFVRGLGLDGSTPGWEFTRTDGKRLEGNCRLELIVQAGHGTALSVAW